MKLSKWLSPDALVRGNIFLIYRHFEILFGWFLTIQEGTMIVGISSELGLENH